MKERDDKLEELKQGVKDSKIKILHIDIETAPNVAHVWGMWKQNVGINQLMDSSYTMCWAAKWHGKEEILFSSLYRQRPLTMIKKIWVLLDKADAVVHYNGEKFDIPTLNKEFLHHGLAPPSTYKQIDLLKVAKRQFRFPSNKLDYVAKALGLGQKVKHIGHELWVKCMNKDAEAWSMMEEYNRQDVALLELVFNKLLPWIKPFPNINLYNENGNMRCPRCGSDKLSRNGHDYTQASKYQRFKCKICGSNMRGRKNMADRDPLTIAT
jgi:DNA polymerase elongation subunit (family B)